MTQQERQLDILCQLLQSNVRDLSASLAKALSEQETLQARITSLEAAPSGQKPKEG